MMENFDERRWKLFLHICDKQDLDLKGLNIQDYKSNFECAFVRAHNVVKFYDDMASKLISKENYDKE